MSAETDFPHAIAEVLRATENADFHPHEIDRQVAPVDLGKAHGILLRGDDALSLALLAAVDRVQHLLLLEAVMISVIDSLDRP